MTKYRAEYYNGKIKEGGFSTEQEAWEYVYKRCCPYCQSIDGGRGSQCSAEWFVDAYESNLLKRLYNYLFNKD